jgi:hypothetical protein
MGKWNALCCIGIRVAIGQLNQVVVRAVAHDLSQLHLAVHVLHLGIQYTGSVVHGLAAIYTCTNK